MFDCRLDRPSVNAPARLRRMLQRTTSFDPRLHLDLMREADLWNKTCSMSGTSACDVAGPRGDLFFLLKTYDLLFQTSACLHIHHLWSGRFTPQPHT